MNGKSILKFAAVAAIVCVAASARVYASATIALGADDANFFGTAGGAALPVGDAVYVGQFSVNDATIAALMSGGTVSPANYATLVSDFVPLNGTSLNVIGTGAAGYAGTIVANYTGSNAGFAGGAIYTLVVNTATTSGASQVGVFKGDATWTFPANMNTGAVTIDTDNALTAPLIGSFATVPGSTVQFNTDGNGYDTVGLLELATIVPEPSTYLLVGTGLLGLLGLRRRRS